MGYEAVLSFYVNNFVLKKAEHEGIKP